MRVFLTMIYSIYIYFLFPLEEVNILIFLLFILLVVRGTNFLFESLNESIRNEAIIASKNQYTVP